MASKILSFKEVLKSNLSKVALMLHQIDCKSKIVSAVTNGTYTFVGLATHQVRCFNWKTGRLVRSYEGHTGPVVCILLSQNKRHMYTGSWDKRILCFSIVDRNIVDNMIFAPGPGLTSHNDFVKCMIFSHDEHYIFSGSADGYVSRWDISRNRQAFEPNTPIHENPYITPVTISVSQRAINSLCLLPLSGDGHILLAAACSDGATVVIDGETMEIIYHLQPHPTNVLLVKFAGEILWTACADKYIRGFELPFAMFMEKLYSETGEKTELANSLRSQRETNLCSTELEDWTLDWAFPSDEEIVSKTGHIVAGLRSKRLVFLTCRDKLQEARSSRRFFDGICAVNLVPQVVTQASGDKELDMVVFASWDHFIRRIAYREGDGLNEELSDVSLSDSELEDKRAQIQEVQDSRLRTMLLPPGE
ncbi:WD-repeat protein [Giardia duodenalis assemblage B]|uniref:WD-repeat protein n=1 Tax=Giardia duodenalis assemblage B TaxID=1394984 RepID=A0A132NMP1_GIAIN|nr:WD-repeat protein [Giardia intestinalis assemblage B]